MTPDDSVEPCWLARFRLTLVAFAIALFGTWVGMASVIVGLMFAGMAGTITKFFLTWPLTMKPEWDTALIIVGATLVVVPVLILSAVTLIALALRRLSNRKHALPPDEYDDLLATKGRGELVGAARRIPTKRVGLWGADGDPPPPPAGLDQLVTRKRAASGAGPR